MSSWTPLFFLTSPFSISQREVNAFHSLDRKLFTRLVVNLGRDTVQSIQVMSLWLWFERVGICRKLVDVLLSLPLGVTGALADEAAIILRCIEQDQIPAPLENFEIHITRSFAKTGVSLRFLHHHRQIVVEGVTQAISEVCSRAFKDIILNRSAGNPRDDMWFEPEPAQEESSYHVSEWDDIWEEFKNNNGFSLPPREEFVYPVHEFPVYQSNPEFVPRMAHSSTTRNSSAGSVMSNIRQNFMPNAASGMHYYNNFPLNFCPNAASGIRNNFPQDFVPNAASGLGNNFPRDFVPNAASGIRNNFPQGYVPNEARRMHNNIPQNFAPDAARAIGPTWNQPHHHRQQQRQYTNMIQNNGPDNFSHAFEEDNDISYQHRQYVISNQLSDLFGNMNLAAFNELEMKRDLVPEDDRTLFLTFSKGYPISENEVRVYFTRRYGKCFDDIHMQEVGPDEQVLFARMVVKAESIIHVILGGRPRAKFTINGKHVWARKYVRKGKEKEKGASLSQQQPNSPRSGTSMSG